MPLLKPQALKSLHTIELQPDKMSSKIEIIMMMDIAGRKGNDIAQALDLTPGRVSVIRNSPLYQSELGKMKNRLQEEFVDKSAEKLSAGDPVEEALRGAALEAARTKIELMQSDNEFVKASAAGDILDRAGYKSYTEKTRVTVEVTEKMSERWEKALKYTHVVSD